MKQWREEERDENELEEAVAGWKTDETSKRAYMKVRQNSVVEARRTISTAVVIFARYMQPSLSERENEWESEILMKKHYSCLMYASETEHLYFTFNLNFLSVSTHLRADERAKER